MVVQWGRGVRAKDAQASRHPEMHDERALVEADQQIFGAPLDGAHALIGDGRLEIGVDRPAQAALPDHDHRDAPADEGGRDTAAGRFYFRQFGHGSTAARGIEVYLIFDSLYGTCLRATGSNFLVSILSGCSRLFFVVV